MPWCSSRWRALAAGEYRVAGAAAAGQKAAACTIVSSWTLSSSGSPGRAVGGAVATCSSRWR